MANGNFIVQNGLQIGPLTIDATTGSISTTGNITTTGTTTTFINEIVTGTEAVYGTLTSNTLIIANAINAGTLGNIGANIVGSIYTASQPNITTLAGVTSIGASGATTLTGTLQTAAQTNITSVGTLTGLSVSGNTAHTSTVYAQGIFDNSNRVLSTSAGTGNLSISGTAVTLPATGPGAVATGSSTAIPVVTTDAYGRVSAISTAAVIAPAVTLTGATLASGVTASSLTSVGTLTGLSVSGTTNLSTTTVTGNLTVTGNINTTGNVNNITITGNSGQFFGNTGGFGALYAGIGSGFFLEPQMVLQLSSNFNGFGGLNQQNINSGSLASTDTFWTPNNGTANDTYLDIGIASSTYSYPGFALIGPNDSYIISAGNATTGGGNMVLSTTSTNDIVFATVGTNANNEVMRVTRANVVAIKSTVASSSTTTGALTVAGGAGIAGAVFVGSTLTLPSIAHSGTTGVGDIGASGAAFGTVWATATSAKYADLAENYQADMPYQPGQVLMFGGEKEVTLADAETTAVAGVVSTNPAHLMNGSLSGPNVSAIALQGRVPCNVIGSVKKGDLMISAGFGFAKASKTPQIGQVIGKALSDFNGAKGQIEVVVGRV